MKSFTEEFQVSIKKNNYAETTDYETFPNKVLLDELRNKIIQNLIDNRASLGGTLDSFIKRQVDATIEGYDLTGVEISYIYNMIDNEINGCGPLTELMEDPNTTEIMVNGIAMILSKKS